MNAEKNLILKEKKSNLGLGISNNGRYAYFSRCMFGDQYNFTSQIRF